MNRVRWNAAIPRRILSVLWAAVMTVIVVRISAQEILPGQVTSVEVRSQTPQAARVWVGTSGETRVHAFRTTTPPRVVLEVTNAAFSWGRKELVLNQPIIKKIRGGQYLEKPVRISRILFDLQGPVSVQAVPQEGGLLLTLTAVTSGPAAVAAAPAPVAGGAAKAGVPPPPVAAAPSKPRVAKTPSPPGTAAQVNVPAVKPKPPAVTVKAARPTGKPAPVHVVKPVIPRPAPVAAPVPAPKKPVRVAALPPPRPRVARPVSLPPPPPPAPRPRPPARPEPEEESEAKVFDLDFVEADLKDVLRVLSIKSGFNIVPDDDVAGKVSIHLSRVTFDEALEILLSQKNYGYEKVSANHIRVTSRKNTVTRILPLNYARAGTLSGTLAPMLGPLGKIQVDDRLNSLIITEVYDRMRSLEQMVRQLDVRTKQVMIEARIIEVDVSDDLNLGIRWSIAASAGTTTGSGEKGTLTVGAVTTPGRTIPSGTRTEVTPGIPAGAPGGTGVTLGLPGSGGSIVLGAVLNNKLLDVTLGALATRGKTKLLSNPRVATLNNEEASILVGDKVPYTQSTVQTLGQAVQNIVFIDVGIKLTVKPTINADNTILLRVHPEASLVTGTASNGAPLIGAREATTNVLVKTGDTIVIGGLIRETDIRTVEQVPLLADLPVLGYLFKHKTEKNERVELLVFVTPTVIE